MKRNIFIPLILLFLLASAMSETIVLVLKEHRKDISAMDYEIEKSEKSENEKNEKEIEEYKNIFSLHSFIFENLDENHNITKNHLNVINYRNPYFTSVTPPPKFILSKFQTST